MSGSADRPVSDSSLSEIPPQRTGWDVWRTVREVARDPVHRRLRRAFIVSAAVQLVLAPLTSWGFDTPGFVQGVIGLLYRGNPYQSSLYFNPPLGPILQAPLLGLFSVFVPPSAWLRTDPAAIPAEAGTGMASALLPDPAVLFLLKLPLILATLLAGVLLYQIARGWGIDRTSSRRIASLWWLNPLVIWVSAVHGELDALAATCVLGVLYVIQKDHSPLWSGTLLGLGFLGKLYPLALVPPVLALHLARIGGRWTRNATLRIGGFALSVAATTVPFIFEWPAEFGWLYGQGGSLAVPTGFGGLSPLILFNHQIVRLGPVGDGLLAHAWASGLDLVLYLLAGTTLVLATVLAYRWGRPAGRAAAGLPRWMPLMLAWIGAGLLLADPTPEPENLLAVLPALLLAGPILGRSAVRIYLWLSAVGWFLYLAFLTPLAYFLPLAHLFNDGPTPAIDSTVVTYFRNPTFPPTLFWGIAGVLGGGALLGLWALGLWSALPVRWQQGVRSVVAAIRRPSTPR